MWCRHGSPLNFEVRWTLSARSPRPWIRPSQNRWFTHEQNGDFNHRFFVILFTRPGFCAQNIFWNINETNRNSFDPVRFQFHHGRCGFSPSHPPHRNRWDPFRMPCTGAASTSWVNGWLGTLVGWFLMRNPAQEHREKTCIKAIALYNIYIYIYHKKICTFNTHIFYLSLSLSLSLSIYIYVCIYIVYLISVICIYILYVYGFNIMTYSYIFVA